MWSGLLPGGFAAFFLALSYIFSGMSVRRNHRVGTLGLLCRAHIVMGVLAAIGLIFFLDSLDSRWFFDLHRSFGIQHLFLFAGSGQFVCSPAYD